MHSAQKATLLDSEEVFAADQDPWRPIHYLGSKLRALPALEEAIRSVATCGSPVCDLFAGSGTVAAHLAKSRPVAAVDIQEYSRVICDAVLNPVPLAIEAIQGHLKTQLQQSARDGVGFAAQPLIDFEEAALRDAEGGRPESLVALIESGSLVAFNNAKHNFGLRAAVESTQLRLRELRRPPVKSMAFRQFGGVYFSYKQAAELDVVLEFAHSATQKNRATLIAAALSTASEIVNTVGKHFAQPLRPRNKDGSIKSKIYHQAARDRYKSVLDIYTEKLSEYSRLREFPYENAAYKSDYLEFLNSKKFDAGVVYADPPYTRDHYSRFYHVLETFALRDDPIVSANTVRGVTAPSRGIYRADRHQSSFCIRSEAPDAFDGLFGRVANKRVPLVLSYSSYASEKNAHPRVMAMDDLIKLAKSHFRKVELVSAGKFFHSRLNRYDLNKEISYEAETFIICRN